MGPHLLPVVECCLHSGLTCTLNSHIHIFNQPTFDMVNFKKFLKILSVPHNFNII